MLMLMKTKNQTSMGVPSPVLYNHLSHQLKPPSYPISEIRVKPMT
jgi:hypothetical protein